MRQYFLNLTYMRSRYILIPLILLFGVNCVYFNLFYNAEQSYNDAMKIIEETPLTEDGKLPPQAIRLLETSIEKSNKVIEKYKDSKYVDDAIFFIGRASFYKENYPNAKEYFNRLLTEFPSSPFVLESRIWLAHCNLKLNQMETALTEINSLISDDKLNNNEKYYAYKVLGEIKLEQDSLLQAFNYFSKAATYTSEEGKKSSIYSKMVKLSEDNKDFNKAVEFLSLLEMYASSTEIRHNAKMKWIEYSRIIGNYDEVLNEIEDMLSLSEYESLYLSLELERAKIAFDRKDFVSAKRDLSFITDKYSQKKETAEAYYYLGHISLFSDLDFERAKEYFLNVSTEYNRSDYKNQAGFYLSKIERYSSIKEEYEELIDSETTSEDTISDKIDNLPFEIVENDTIVADTELLVLDEVTTSDTLIAPNQIYKSITDSLLFTMAEIMVFDFASNDIAVQYYTDLVQQYPDSKFAPQALYTLSQKSNEKEKWLDILKTDFPNSEYLRNEFGTTDSLSFEDNPETLRYNAWKTLEKSPKLAHDEFFSIYEQYNDTLSFYITATISDYYLMDFQGTLEEYSEFIEKFPNHKITQLAKTRLSELEKNLEDQLSIYEAELNFNKGINSLILSFDTDSALYYFNEAGEVKVANGLKNNALNFQTNLQKYSQLSDKWYFNTELDYTKTDSLELNSDVTDSLHFLMGELFYYGLHLPDSALNHYQKIIQDYPESNFRLPSLIAMKQLQPEEDWIDAFREEIPDSLYEQINFKQNDFQIPLTLIDSSEIENLQWKIDTYKVCLDQFLETTTQDTIEFEVVESTLPVENESTIEDISIIVRSESDESYTSKTENEIEVLGDSIDFKEMTIKSTEPEENIESRFVKQYLVLPGDNLISISQNEYNDFRYWKQIYEWNLDEIGENPDKIYTFQILDLKFDESTTKVEPKFVIYFVKRFDTLWSIADIYYGDPYAWIVIYRDNEELLAQNKGILLPQMELKIRETLEN